MKLFALRSTVLACASLAFATLAWAAPSFKVTYNPAVNPVSGNQPMHESYVVTITSPTNLVPGDTVNVALVITVLSKPNTTITDAEALGFISVNPAALAFTGPNQAKSFTVSLDVPVGSVAGDYSYNIAASGWPTNLGVILDAGATINARVLPSGATDTTPPSVTLLSPTNGASYTYLPASGNPVNVPVSFSGSVSTSGSPVGTMSAEIVTPTQTIPITLTTSALPSYSATATGSVDLTAPGNYTVTVSAGNANGTSYTSAAISVTVQAPPPAIAVASPTSNSTFNYTLGGAGASVPVTFTATSIYSNVSSLSATLDGNPVTLVTSGVGTSTSASGSASLTVAATGTHSLVFTAANDFGPSSVTVPFTVTGTVPAPAVAILSPAPGSSFSRAAGDPPTVVNFAFQGGTAYGTIASAAVTLDGNPMAAAVVGLNSASITGSGSASFTAAGSHTLNVTLLNSGGALASASTSFTVSQTGGTQVCEDLTWLPPIALNKTIDGGSEMPVKFTLECRNKFVRDTSVLIAIYEVYRNGSTSTPVIYHYGTGSPNPPDYAITGKQYQLNFDTDKGTHSYQIEVYSSASGSMQLLGSKELNTQGRSNCDGHGGHGGDDDDGGHH